MSVRPYSPPAGGSTPDLKTRRCSRADFYQLSIRTEREVDPPSSIRHQKAFAVSDEIDQCVKNDRTGERRGAPPPERPRRASPTTPRPSPRGFQPQRVPNPKRKRPPPSSRISSDLGVWESEHPGSRLRYHLGPRAAGEGGRAVIRASGTRVPPLPRPATRVWKM